MNCCSTCFVDPGLQNRITALSKESGNCDFCGSLDIPIVHCGHLSDDFEPIFEQYTNHPNALLSLKVNQPFLIHEHILVYWPKLFNTDKIRPQIVKSLLNQIGRGWDGFTEPLFENAVELEIYTNGINEDESYNLKWSIFSKEIKEENRFFFNPEGLDFDKLSSTFERFVTTYPRNTVFYRARISEVSLKKGQLGKPPKAVTTPGRANPVGIPYLYISDSEETTLYETRVSLHENITVGKFRVESALQVISLKNIIHYGPFEIQDKGFELEEFMQIRPYLLKLEEELSKPVRRQDLHLDYLPTQYLCEYIKSLGFDAVEYRSAMTEKGYNLAVFNDKKLKCISTKHYNIQELKYKWG